MALGRNNSIRDKEGRLRMPMSVSDDMGKTWHQSASEFPPIDGGQRLVLMRLNEGPILLISFTEHPYRTPKEERGMMFTEKSGKPFKGYGMYAALSYDEGKTWPVKRLLTDGTYRFLNGGAWTQFFEMDENHAEPRGYLAGTQTPDNMIHLITSRFYYKFNLAWLKENQYNKVKSIYEKHFICLRIFASLWDAPFMGQFQDSLNEDQTIVRIWEGDNQDPSIVRYGKSYYLVHSSFVYIPGLVVYTSDDLVNLCL